MNKTRHLIVILIAGSALLANPSSLVAEGRVYEDSEQPPGPVHVVVSGASAGITTDYFESVVVDAVTASGLFSGIDNSEKTKVTVRMLRTSSTFSGVESATSAPYFLKVRIIKIETPSFSTRMTVSLNAIWELYRTAENEKLLHENIYSTYTGGLFEGGLHGANRVRVAIEGAARSNVDVGIDKLASLNLGRE